MKNREVVILPSAINDIKDITRFVTDHTSELNAIEYADELIDADKHVFVHKILPSKMIIR